PSFSDFGGTCTPGAPGSTVSTSPSARHSGGRAGDSSRLPRLLTCAATIVDSLAPDTFPRGHSAFGRRKQRTRLRRRSHGAGTCLRRRHELHPVFCLYLLAARIVDKKS